jgi:putative NADH-flavin reductase
MRLAVFGATGGVGGHVVRQALARGDDVTAVVRDPSRLAVRHERLDVVVADLTDPAALSLAGALTGVEAAISGVGARSRAEAGVATAATRTILAALATGGVRQFVAVSAAPVGPAPDGEGVVTRRVLLPIMRRVFRDVYADLANMEEEIRRSGLQWTIVRPPRLTNGPLTGRYRTAPENVRDGRTISRADVADALLSALDDADRVNRAVGVAN